MPLYARKSKNDLGGKSMEIILMFCSAIWIVFGLITNTKNVPSAIIYKVMPVVTGLLVMLCGMNLNGWVNIW
jgi:hypothetical protein